VCNIARLHSRYVDVNEAQYAKFASKVAAIIALEDIQEEANVRRHWTRAARLHRLATFVLRTLLALLHMRAMCTSEYRRASESSRTKILADAS